MNLIFLKNGFNIEPRKSILELLNKLEKQFGEINIRNIRKNTTFINKQKYGLKEKEYPARVEKRNGIYTVFLSKKFAEEAHLLHELLHIELDFIGIKRFSVSYKSPDKGKLAFDRIANNIINQLFNLMEHKLMYPKFTSIHGLSLSQFSKINDTKIFKTFENDLKKENRQKNLEPLFKISIILNYIACKQPYSTTSPMKWIELGSIVDTNFENEAENIFDIFEKENWEQPERFECCFKKILEEIKFPIIIE